MSLGVRRVRQIAQSRGSKEGNDAFVKVLCGYFVMITNKEKAVLKLKYCLLQIYKDICKNFF